MMRRGRSVGQGRDGQAGQRMNEGVFNWHLVPCETPNIYLSVESRTDFSVGYNREPKISDNVSFEELTRGSLSLSNHHRANQRS